MEMLDTHHTNRLHVLIDIIFSVAVIFVSGDEDDGYFGQEQVPLTDEIREILEEYPDGQIFKVCTDYRLYGSGLCENVICAGLKTCTNMYIAM